MEQVYKSTNEGMRQLLEIAVCCGRCWQSPQTGYIHYCYHLYDEKFHHPIPTYENLIFALALLRTRHAENIADAKELLRRLLYFQSREGEMAGNFPSYLHEYPFCSDSFLGAHLLVPFYWIYRYFHHVLGSEIKQALKMTLIRLQNYCLQTVNQKEVPYAIALKVAASAKAVGPLLDQGEIANKGDRLYKGIQEKPDKTAWNSPASLSDILLAYQMLFPLLSKASDQSFWDHLTTTWHKESCSYCGPGWKEFQSGKEPKVTFYDYFMGYLTGTFSMRCFIDHPVQLQAALVHPTEDKLPNFAFPIDRKGMIQGLPWELIQKEKMAVSVIAKENSITNVQEKAFAPLKILSGNFQCMSSFVCQGGTCPSIDYTLSDNQVDLLFSFSDPVEVEDHEKSQEVSFFINDEEGMSILVEGTTATTFRLGEQLTIFARNLKIVLSFHLHLGDGEFVGHIMKGNRPSQFSLAGVHRFAAYDWQIFLRTIRRSEECTIKVTAQTSEIDET